MGPDLVSTWKGAYLAEENTEEAPELEIYLRTVWYWGLIRTNVFVSFNPGQLLFSSSDGPLS